MTSIPPKSISITGAHLIQQAARQATELFQPTSPYMQKAVKTTFVPMQTDWVVESALKKAKILPAKKSIQSLVESGHLEVTSPKRSFLTDQKTGEVIQWGQDFDDYRGNPLLAMNMLSTHGDLGRAGAKRVDLLPLKKVAPALHKVLRDPDNSNLLRQVIEQLNPAEKKELLDALCLL